VTWGSLQYTRRSVKTKIEKKVNNHKWICWQALFLEWRTCGKLEAAQACDVLTINVDHLARALEARTTIIDIINDYGSALCETLKTKRFDDLEFPDPDLVFARMQPEIRSAMAAPAIDALKESACSKYLASRRKSLADIEREVREGKCSLRLDANVGVLRTVSIILLRLSRDDNSLCVKVGEWDGEKSFPNSKVQLPGKKKEPGVCPENDVMLLIRKEFQGLEDQIEIIDHEVDSELDISQSSELPSKYMRTIFNARLMPSAYSCPLFKMEVELNDNVFDVEIFQRDESLYMWVSKDDFVTFSKSDVSGLFAVIMSEWTGSQENILI